ncbi:predicted protein [Streptomyces iranensis]|uniref:Uncharacterized protein n=1 Tax=Streptomyces iranensis TaxID=576784 RepID=A0A060ZGE6_9ACTN|nr:predicted protein [Streptomyces iranensis]
MPEQVRTVAEPHVQPLVRDDQQGQGVVHGVPPRDVDRPQFPARIEQLPLVDGVVLEDRRRVEEVPGAHSAQPLDLGEPQVLVVEQLRLLLLEPGEQPAQRLLGIDAQPYRHGVDEQAHDGLHTRQLRGAARDRGAEHHVVPPGEPPEDQPPRRLDEGVQREPRAPGAL